MLSDMVAEDAQFISATHSPILLAFPRARINSFDRTPVREVAYEELDHVALTRHFLNHPERYLGRLTALGCPGDLTAPWRPSHRAS